MNFLVLFFVPITMEMLPFIYLLFVGLMADVIGSFRTIGRIATFFIFLAFTPFLGIFIVLAFPRLPNAVCMADYLNFHAGIAYRFRRRHYKGRDYFIMVNDTDVIISSYEFSEYFAVVETRKQYLRKKKLFKDEKINY